MSTPGHDQVLAACKEGALLPGRDDGALLEQAIALSRHCPPSRTAYSVGAVLVAADGSVLSTGYSRQDGSPVHAEEAALRALPPGAELRTATLYCSLEPCSERASAPRPCAELIVSAGVGRVVVGWREPELFVARCRGLEQLRDAGVAVEELPAYADLARRSNGHLPLGRPATGPPGEGGPA
ncbi:deaminase [Streptomyces sp. NPDC059740]|uniref:deaminase n=1 Tax=Streptomyces sp. NPDC059740 TaxID=3346926 RepID=UPI0036542BEA